MTGKSLYYQILDKGYTKEELDQVIYLLNRTNPNLKIPEADTEQPEDKASERLIVNQFDPASVK